MDFYRINKVDTQLGYKKKQICQEITQDYYSKLQKFFNINNIRKFDQRNYNLKNM